ncbi:MAG: adenylate/guanylate cyclase domain-containing protein [Dehalococcoidia bacterium]
MIADEQVSMEMRMLFEEQLAMYKEGATIQVVGKIPETTEIPIQNPRHWLRIPDVVCVVVDMKGSTQLSAASRDKETAAAYQMYSGTAVRVFAELQSPYIDVRGDGVLALFDSGQEHRALAAAVTFKTFASEIFAPAVTKQTGLTIGSHCAIDQKTVLVRRIGYKRYGGRTDRQNEVWAGKPVNMAAKLASLTEDNELLVSERFFEQLTDDHALLSCGCPNGVRTPLWKERDLTEDRRFDFDKAYSLRSTWCKTHGKLFCKALLDADDK